jgi:tRNA(Ile)-lysidine synthase
MTLLQLLATRRSELAGELRAVHVNHGLQPQADEWQRQCERVCAGLDVPLECRRINVPRIAGESLEATARERRYAVFTELMATGDILLLAHHQDDQLETFLLQALRGAGVRGLSAMPATAEFAAGLLVRPLLPFSRAELEAWARPLGFAWVEDPSNQDLDFDRNYLRQEIVPRLRARWPAAANTVSRSARLCAEAAELVDELAAADWAEAGRGAALPLKSLESLSGPRARNLLRYWLRSLGLPTPPAHKLDEILNQLPARADRNPCIDWPGAEVRRYRRRLYAQAPLPPPPADFTLMPGARRELGAGLGSLGLVPATGEGIRAALLPLQGLQVAFRSGGESCRPAGRDHQRPLKKWLQELHVLPWLRGSLPLLYADGRLLAVAGLFVCEPYAANAGEAGLRVDWLEHPPLS